MNNQKTILVRPYLIILATIVLIRVVTLGVPDLFDTTEGRYATTSQLMVERSDWVTPWIIFKGVEKPYLGKPPLHFWLINTCYELFGLNNFSARLPGVLSGAAITLILYIFTLQVVGQRAALASALIFSSSLLAFILSGVCLVDVTLTVGITLAVAGFALADRSRLAGFLCVIGLAIGVLVKGPVAVIFFGMVVGPWVAIRWFVSREIPTQLKQLPWIPGIIIFVAIALPWYLLAEQRNPGFIKYFIWTENIGRFSKSDYGDEYGNGHIQIRGAAWVMLFPSLVPWSLALIGTLLEQRKRISFKKWVVEIKGDHWLSLGFFWSISTPLLLLFAKQYTPTYNMSAIPGFAFLLAIIWRNATLQSAPWLLFSQRTVRTIIVSMGLTVGIASIIFYTRAADPSEIETIFAVLVAIALVTIATRPLKFKDPMAPIAALSLIAAVGYGTTMIAGNAYLSSHRSTKNILAYAASLTPHHHQNNTESLKIGFATNLPFSARFYSALMANPSVHVSQVEQHELATATEDLIIARKNKGDLDIVSSEPTMKKIGEFGRWRVYRRVESLNQ